METKKFITKLLYGSIALAGLIAATVILFAKSDDAIGNSIGTAFLIILTDGFILLGLVSRHQILKIALWVSSIYAMAMSTLFIWLPRPELVYSSYREYDYGISAYTPEGEAQNNLIETFGNLTFGAYILSFGLSIAVLFSLFSSLIESNKKILESEEKLSDLFYKIALGVGVFSTVIFAIAASFEIDGFILRLGFASLLIAVTAAVIMAIATITSTSKASAKRVQNRYNMTQQNNFMVGSSGKGKMTQPTQEMFPQHNTPNPDYSGHNHSNAETTVNHVQDISNELSAPQENNKEPLTENDKNG